MCFSADIVQLLGFHLKLRPQGCKFLVGVYLERLSRQRCAVGVLRPRHLFVVGLMKAWLGLMSSLLQLGSLLALC